MHRLSASGVQRQGALDARAKLAGPAGKEDEERDEKRLSKADRTARPTSSATFSTLSTHLRHEALPFAAMHGGELMSKTCYA